VTSPRGERIVQLRAEPLCIPFRSTFRHASAARSETSSVHVVAASPEGHSGHGESCPRPYVTGETVESALAFASAHSASLRAGVVDPASLDAWMTRHAGDVEANPAAWCAMELAVLDVLARIGGSSVEALIGRPPLRGTVRYSAVLGDAEPAAFRTMAERYLAQGFRDFKVKLSGDLARDRGKLDALRPFEGIRVRADANNAWDRADEALAFLASLDYRFFAIEEPIRPDQYGELARLAEALECRIVLDESFVRLSQLDAVRAAGGAFILNVRVSKMGGLLRSLRVVEAARDAGVGIVVGAQVGETSLLTRAGLTVAAAAGDALVAQEGAFGTHLLAQDLFVPALMFGEGGALDTERYPALQGAGWGLEVLPAGAGA
jgi:L-alanine-DL-glutamate epimerase-like enolase superfamily enzyme